MQPVSSSQEVGTELCPIRIEVCFHQGRGDLPCLCRCLYALSHRHPFASMPLLACSSLPLLSSLPKCEGILSFLFSGILSDFYPQLPLCSNLHSWALCSQVCSAFWCLGAAVSCCAGCGCRGALPLPAPGAPGSLPQRASTGSPFQKLSR